MSDDKDYEQDVARIDKQIQRDVEDFNDLLDTLSTTEERKKKLWKKIYYNALIDRRNAYTMYLQLVDVVANDSTAHSLHGQTIAKYLERMSKSNEQLIKLAEIVDGAVVEQEETFTSNDSLLEEIEKRRNNRSLQ